MLIIDGRINSYAMKYGNLNKKDFSRMMLSFEKLNNENIYIDDTPNIKLRQLKSNALVMVRKGVKIIFVDYLTLIQLEDAKNIPRYERVGIIIKSIKQLSRELNIPIVVLSQVRRESEGKRPTLADLRQSGEIEEDADIICFIHGERERDEREFIVAKNRDGGLDIIKLHFNRPCLRFDDIEKEE
jgi:replicative DNA helicase